ncbi:MAG: tripartite tricarboxylate transporter substrate binding protein [Rhodocyclaceae bacterium]|nr:tripartite tricarboxylate transporter substrate binding protein [Rhodocyclaceae bacterium]
MHRRCLVIGLPFAFAFAAVAPSVALAQPLTGPGGFPAKSVRVVVPAASGSLTDPVARIVSEELGRRTGQSWVIENRPGAGGMIGSEAVARAVPDGYTLGVGSLGSLVLSPVIDPKLRYDPLKDVTPIASVAVTHYVLAVHPSVPAKTAQDLVRIARERRGKLNYGSSGVGSISHLIAEALQSATPGIEMVHVAYKGIAPALAALIGGEIDLAFLTLPQAESSAKAGRLRLLAATGATRPEGAKALPTLLEAGLKVHPVEGSYGLVGPAGLPRDVVVRLNAQVNAALKSPDFRQRFESQGFEAVAPNSPEDYVKQIRGDLEVFGRVVKRAGIKPEG